MSGSLGFGGFGNSLREGVWLVCLLACFGRRILKADGRWTDVPKAGLFSTGDSCNRIPDSWDLGIRLGIAVVWALKRLPTYPFTSIHYLFGNMKIDVPPPPIIIEWTKEKENSRIQVCAFAKPLVSSTGLFANIIEGIDGTVGKHVHLHVHG